jgi:hypothetical protein
MDGIGEAEKTEVRIDFLCGSIGNSVVMKAVSSGTSVVGLFITGLLVRHRLTAACFGARAQFSQ